jgi:hypothetical protein
MKCHFCVDNIACIFANGAEGAGAARDSVSLRPTIRSAACAAISTTSIGERPGTREASDRITRALAGYRTYCRSSRAYAVCGQSWTYAMRREIDCVHWFVSRIGNGRETSSTFFAAVPCRSR